MPGYWRQESNLRFKGNSVDLILVSLMDRISRCSRAAGFGLYFMPDQFVPTSSHCTVEINRWIGAAFAVRQMLYCFVAQRELANLLVDQGPQIMPSSVGYYCSLLEERSTSGEQTQCSSLPFLTYSLFCQSVAAVLGAAQLSTLHQIVCHSRAVKSALHLSPFPCVIFEVILCYVCGNLTHSSHLLHTDLVTSVAGPFDSHCHSPVRTLAIFHLSKLEILSNGLPSCSPLSTLRSRPWLADTLDLFCQTSKPCSDCTV